jgi:phosphatidylserine/phosphatidylglycerophosphate/cardiolipin synthase-like enzyme
MSRAQLEQLLESALADNRLTRAERQALAARIADDPLEPAELQALHARAFDLAAERLTDPAARQVLETLDDVLKSLRPRDSAKVAATDAEPGSLAHFSPGDRCLRQIIRLFENTARTADLAVFTITDDRISSAILSAHKRGASIRIVTDNDKAFDPGSDIDRLRDAGIPVRIDRTPFHMHHKFAIFDNRLLAMVPTTGPEAPPSKTSKTSSSPPTPASSPPSAPSSNASGSPSPDVAGV